eukprot:9047840-Pyramimonas_sp.AAC.1
MEEEGEETSLEAEVGVLPKELALAEEAERKASESGPSKGGAGRGRGGKGHQGRGRAGPKGESGAASADPESEAKLTAAIEAVLGPCMGGDDSSKGKGKGNDHHDHAGDGGDGGEDVDAVHGPLWSSGPDATDLHVAKCLVEAGAAVGKAAPDAGGGEGLTRHARHAGLDGPSTESRLHSSTPEGTRGLMGAPNAWFSQDP